MSNNVVSVIVPVYNVEIYLSYCIESIISQSYKKTEIILVDDGSTDSSGKICDDYARKYNNILVIHQNNRGLSAARNSALEIAKGDYTICVDSDDFLAPNCIEVLMNHIIKYGVDIACCGTVYCDENGAFISEEKINKGLNVAKENALKHLLVNKHVTTTAWGKLYKTEIFDGIRYPEGRFHEDVFTTYKLFDKACGVYIIPECLYWYRQVNKSITHIKFQKKHMDSLIGNVERADFIVTKYPEIKKYAYATIAYSALKLLNRMYESNGVNEKYEDELIDYIKKYGLYLLMVKDYSFATKFTVILIKFLTSLTIKLLRIKYSN